MEQTKKDGTMSDKKVRLWRHKLLLAIVAFPLLGAPVCGFGENLNPLVDAECKDAYRMRDSKYGGQGTLMCGDDSVGTSVQPHPTSRECPERTLPICDFLHHVGDRGAIRYSGEHECAQFGDFEQSECFNTDWSPLTTLPLLGCTGVGTPNVYPGETLLINRRSVLGPIDELYFVFQPVVFGELTDGTVVKTERVCDRRLKMTLWGYGRNGDIVEEGIEMYANKDVVKVPLLHQYDGEVAITYEVSANECLSFCGDMIGDVVMPPDGVEARDPLWVDRKGVGHVGGMWGVADSVPDTLWHSYINL